MAHTRKKVFDGLYAQLEETDGHVVLFSAKGEPSIIFEMTNPVQQLCTDAEQYVRFQEVLGGVLIIMFFRSSSAIHSSKISAGISASETSPLRNSSGARVFASLL